ncbi:hypothetical protein L345_03448 [Ophiophagus hannah]|uniref:Uncharacterized protein n=1 Tax=Ophiophagus hannah TaxID=8665 RepID=V8P854_OPHHA|nr:hypothetical protein L345_03448 [Ophiophagus hannah]
MEPESVIEDKTIELMRLSEKGRGSKVPHRNKVALPEGQKTKMVDPVDPGIPGVSGEDQVLSVQIQSLEEQQPD